MSFRELQLLFKELGYTLYKDRDYRGVGYFISKDIEIEYLGSTIGEVTERYLQIKKESYND